MAVELPGYSYSFVAGEDLSTKQFYFMKQDANGACVTCAAITDKPLGILQNNPGLGGEAQVMMDGVSKVSADVALAIDDLVGTSADGQAAVVVPGTATTVYIVGRVLGGTGVSSGAGGAAGAAGELASIAFSCLGIGGLRGA